MFGGLAAAAADRQNAAAADRIPIFMTSILAGCAGVRRGLVYGILNRGMPLVLALGFVLVVALQAAPAPGSAVYRQACARCHDGGEGRAPKFETLRLFSQEAIMRSLREGNMRFVGSRLPAAALSAVAAYISSAESAPPPAESNPFPCESVPFADPFEGPRWIGWGADLQNSRFQPGAAARLAAADVARLELQWAFGFRGAAKARGHPAVAGGRLYVGSESGAVYALDAKSGCRHWKYEARGGVRGAIVIGPGESGRFIAYFGDQRANLYAVDAETGKELWRNRLDEHPGALITASPLLHEGRVFAAISSIGDLLGSRANYECCKFRGAVAAVDALSGERIWKSYTIPEEPAKVRKNRNGVQLWGPSGAAIWSAPTIDEKLGRIYVTTGNNYSDPVTDDSDAVIAFDLKTGERVWSRQFTPGDAWNMACSAASDHVNCPQAQGPDFDFGSSGILVDIPGGKRLLLLGQKSGILHAVDPDRNGAIVWQRRVGRGGMLGGIQFGPAADRSNVYVALSDIQRITTRGPDGKAAGGPVPNSGGGLSAYDLASGERKWFVRGFTCPPQRKGCSPAQSAAVSVIPGVVFSGSLDGHLRAYAAESGKVIWDFDTVRAYAAVNGVEARGGSLNGPGPVIVDGMVYVNSGYGQFGSTPGNVFLAFGLPGGGE